MLLFIYEAFVSATLDDTILPSKKEKQRLLRLTSLINRARCFLTPHLTANYHKPFYDLRESERNDGIDNIC